MDDLMKAKELLYSGGYTCVLYKDGDVRTCTARGVRPLVAWLEGGERFTAYSAADKVVGKATAFLYVLLGVRAVYSHVISKGALEVLQRFGIEAEYKTHVPNIINRAGDGICPFEQAVTNADTPEDAYREILGQMKRMGIPL